jgi:hypothetical protein
MQKVRLSESIVRSEDSAKYVLNLIQGQSRKCDTISYAV